MTQKTELLSLRPRAKLTLSIFCSNFEDIPLLRELTVLHTRIVGNQYQKPEIKTTGQIFEIIIYFIVLFCKVVCIFKINTQQLQQNYARLLTQQRIGRSDKGCTMIKISKFYPKKCSSLFPLKPFEKYSNKRHFQVVNE